MGWAFTAFTWAYALFEIPGGWLGDRGLSSFFDDFVMPPAWAACMDIGGRYSGTLSGSMNMVGNFAGGFSPLVVGYLLAWTAQNWTLTVYISDAIYSLGAICWMFLDSQEPLGGSSGRAGLSAK